MVFVVFVGQKHWFLQCFCPLPRLDGFAQKMSKTSQIAFPIYRFPMNSHDISLVFFHDTRSKKKTLSEIVLMVFAQSQAMFRAMFVGPRPAVATKARESVS